MAGLGRETVNRMTDRFDINLFDLVMSLSNTLDLVEPTLSNHHKRVAYIALRIADAVALDKASRQELFIAAALHDIGVLSTEQRVSGDSLDSASHHSDSFGYQLLRTFEPFAKAAALIRTNHVPWEHGTGGAFGRASVPKASQILHLANRIELLIDDERQILLQVDEIRRRVKAQGGAVFVPEFVEAFLSLAGQEAFWLDIVSPGHESLLTKHVQFAPVRMDLDGLLEFAQLLAHVIDFRSRFTSTHSSGVAACAEVLGHLRGYPPDVCKKLKIAGFLHDVGKLALPVDVLDKPGRLDPDEMQAVRAHPYHTYRILQPIRGLEEIATWCALHHERLDGSGYPFRAEGEGIPMEARIVAVADVFTALTEDRPYRKGMVESEATLVLRDMARSNALDSELVERLCGHFEHVNTCRAAAQEEAVGQYEAFMQSLKRLDLAWAREAHFSWKKRLRRFLDGKERIEPGELLSHSNCALGRWYAREGLTYYGHIPEMHELWDPHREMHHAVEQVVRYAESQCYTEAEDSLIKVDLLSVHIVRLLETIEESSELPQEPPNNVVRRCERTACFCNAG